VRNLLQEICYPTSLIYLINHSIFYGVSLCRIAVCVTSRDICCVLKSQTEIFSNFVNGLYVCKRNSSETRSGPSVNYKNLLVEGGCRISSIPQVTPQMIAAIMPLTVNRPSLCLYPSVASPLFLFCHII